MTDARAVKASYCNIRPIPTRGQVQLILELPLEEMASLIAKLGVPAMPGESKWVAVALLDPKAQLKDMLERSREADQEAEGHNIDETRCACGEILLFDDENGIASCPSCKSYESYIPPRNKQEEKRAKLKLVAKERYASLSPELQAVADAGRLGQDPQFKAWAMAHCAAHYVFLDASQYIRDFCLIESRRDIATNPEAYQAFMRLKTEFETDVGRLADGRR
jgi:hypothetical protein